MLALFRYKIKKFIFFEKKKANGSTVFLAVTIALAVNGLNNLRCY